MAVENAVGNAEAETVSFEILDQGNALRLRGPDRTLSRFHAVWLRDNGQDARTRDPFSHQKLVTLNEIPRQTRIKSVSVNGKRQLEVEFSPDGWTTVFDLEWLWARRYDRTALSTVNLFEESVSTWGSELSTHMPRVSYGLATTQDQALYDWLVGINRYGVALMDDVPTRSQAVLDVIGLFGCVRETNYGRFFEIRAVPQPTNLAASALGLQVHTDNPYRDPVPTMQFFACLQNDAQGGESIVVDGFRAAERLKTQFPEQFALLTRYNARFDFHGSKDVHLQSSRPIIECAPDGKVICVRFNNRSADAITEVPFDQMEAYYDAYRKFAELLTDPEQEVSFKLNPGQLFVTDNTRVLHSRKAFSGGARWMQGAYADKDLLKSKILTLRKQLASTSTPSGLETALSP